MNEADRKTIQYALHLARDTAELHYDTAVFNNAIAILDARPTVPMAMLQALTAGDRSDERVRYIAAKFGYGVTE